MALYGRMADDSEKRYYTRRQKDGRENKNEYIMDNDSMY